LSNIGKREIIKIVIAIGLKLFFALFALSIGILAFILCCNQLVVVSTSSSIVTVDELKDNDYDCIIVLGAGVKNGKPSWMLEDRILTGIETYNKTGAKLLMSGDHSKTDYNEVGIMKDYAIENANIPSEDIFMDHAGFSTYDSMYRAKHIFGAKKVIIISQKYHLYRAIYAARELGMEAYGVSADLRNYHKMPYYKFRESIARGKEVIKLLFKPEPTYLGETISLDGSGDVTND